MGEHTENGREFLTPVGEVNLLSENAPLTIQVCVCAVLLSFRCLQLFCCSGGGSCSLRTIDVVSVDASLVVVVVVVVVCMCARCVFAVVLAVLLLLVLRCSV